MPEKKINKPLNSYKLNLKLDNKNFKKGEFNSNNKKESMLSKSVSNLKCILKKWNKFLSRIQCFSKRKSNNICKNNDKLIKENENSNKDKDYKHSKKRDNSKLRNSKEEESDKIMKNSSNWLNSQC